MFNCFYLLHDTKPGHQIFMNPRYERIPQPTAVHFDMNRADLEIQMCALEPYSVFIEDMIKVGSAWEEILASGKKNPADLVLLPHPSLVHFKRSDPIRAIFNLRGNSTDTHPGHSSINPSSI